MQADALEARALGQPDQVRRVVVAQGPGRALGDRAAQGLGPEGDELGASLGPQRGAADRGGVPFGHQLGLEQQRLHGRRGAARGRCPRPPAARRAAPWRGAWRAAASPRRSARTGAAVAVDHRLGAEILENEEAVGEVLAVDARRREAEGPQAPVDGHEGVDALGELDDRAVGLAVAHRRAVGPGRRDRQDGAGAVGLASGARRRGSRRRPASGCARPRPSRCASRSLRTARARSRRARVPPLPSMRTKRGPRRIRAGARDRRRAVGPSRGGSRSGHSTSVMAFSVISSKPSSTSSSAPRRR